MTQNARGRAALAVLLLVGFYVLSLGIVVALIAANVLLYIAGEIYFYLVLLALVATFSILPAVFSLDRRARDIQREGALLVTKAQQPQLWQLVEDVATKVGTRPPDVLLLAADVNAGVLQSGAFLGLRPGKRVMSLGVPLLSVLDEEQLRAVLAHEYGHYTHGHTASGALIYRASSGLSRAVYGVRRRVMLHEALSSYRDLFLRVTRPIIREQEAEADRVAAETTSAEALATALAAVPGAVAVWRLYVDTVLTPTWLNGFAVTNVFTPVPTIYAARPDLRAKALEADLNRAPAEHDTHPALRQRLSTLAWDGSAPELTTGCLDLIQDRDNVEAALRRNMTPVQVRASQLRDISWDEAPEVVAPRLAERMTQQVLTAVSGLPTSDAKTVAGTLGHVFDVLESGRRETLEVRLFRKGATPEGMALALRLTVSDALVRQDKATWAFDPASAFPFAIKATGRAKLDVAGIVDDALSGSTSGRAALEKRKLDLSQSLPDKGPASVADLTRGLTSRR